MMQLAQRKQERDKARLAQQRDNLQRQLARWVAPDILQTLKRDIDAFGEEQRASGGSAAPKDMTKKYRQHAERTQAQQMAAQKRRNNKMAARYARHAMTIHLAQVRRSIVV